MKKREQKAGRRQRRPEAECKVESNWATPGALDVFAFSSFTPYHRRRRHHTPSKASSASYSPGLIYLYFFFTPLHSIFSRDVVKRERVEFNIYIHKRVSYIYTHYTLYEREGGRVTMRERCLRAPTPPVQ